MNYISVKEAAEKWGIGIRRVQFYCSQEKIPGAVNLGKQWVIPADAERPVDGRTKDARSTEEEELYHFPIFIFSPHFTMGMRTCSEDERELLEAQMIHLQGKFVESAIKCREMLKRDVSFSVRYGLHCTIAYNAMLLGLPQEVDICIKEMEKLFNMAKKHTEDYRLILEGIKHHLSWNHQDILKIDVTKLSRDALIYYKYYIYMIAMMTPRQKTENEICLLKALICELESEGPSMGVLATSCILSTIYREENNYEESCKYAQKAVDIALKFGFISGLSKYYTMDKEPIVDYLCKTSPQTIKQLEYFTNLNVANWKVSLKIKSGITTLGGIPIKYASFIKLLAMNQTEKNIAQTLNRTIGEVRAVVKDLCTSLGLTSKNDLIKHVKAQYTALLLDVKTPAI